MRWRGWLALAFAGLCLISGEALAGAATQIAAKGDTQGPTFHFDVTNNAAIDSRLSFTRTSTASYFNSSGALTTASSGSARVDYDPSTLAIRGILLEEARTNYLTYSRDLTNAAWTKTNTSAVKDATGLDAVASSASTLTASAANGTATHTSAATGTTEKAFSVWLKRKTGTGNIQLTINGGTAWTTVSVTSSWQKFEISGTNASPTVGIRIVTSGDAVYVDCAQLEIGKGATSPIVTTSATVTRAQDVMKMTSLTGWYTTAQGSFVVEYMLETREEDSSYPGVVTFHDGTQNNGILPNIDPSTGRISYYITNGGTEQVNTQGWGKPYEVNTLYRTGVRYASNNFAITTNSGDFNKDTAGTPPSSITTLDFLQDSTWSQAANGWVRGFWYWDYALSDDRLDVVTNVDTVIVPAATRDYDFTAGSIHSDFTCERASNAWYFNSSGLLTQASTNVCRIDYDPDTLVCKGALLEGVRTNYVTYSRDLSNAAWTKSNATATKDATGLDGVASSASTLTATAANGYATRTTAATGTARKYYSVYLKRKTGTGNVQLTMNNGTNWTTVAVTSSWQRFSINGTNASPTVGIRLATSGDAVYVDVAQLEIGTFMTSPIVTTTASYTRQYDMLYDPDTTDYYNATEGSFVIEMQHWATAGSTSHDWAVDLWSDSDQGYVGVYLWGANGVYKVKMNGPSSTAIYDDGWAIYTPGDKTKIGVRMKSADHAFYFNGDLETLPTDVGMPGVLNTVYLGTGDSNFYGWIRRYRYWNTGLSNAQLEEATQ